MAALPKPVEVLIFHHSDQTSQMAEAGVDYDFELCDERAVPLYDVAYVKAYKYKKGPLVYSLIGTNGDTMVSPWPPAKMNAILQGRPIPNEF